VSKWQRRAGIAALFLLALPILLQVYQPRIALEAWGLLLGSIGYVISPIILFGVLALWARSKW
jgi:hypothetical protein